MVMITVMNSLFGILILTSLISCGKSVEDKTSEEKPLEEASIDGTYSTLLLPVDASVSARVSGEVKIHKYGDSFKVDIKLKDSPGGIHRQYLQTGTSCDGPGMKILPLDDDLSGQMRGQGFFPSGSYHYKRSTSYYLMLSDLHLPDDNSNDGIVKLDGWELPLEKRPIVIYAQKNGVDVKMACGILTKTSTNENETTSWDEPAPRTPAPEGNVRPRPRPRPEPRPAPVPEVSQPEETEPHHSTWWERMRERMRRWRDRVRGGGGDPRLDMI
jgi:hypothetical protein